MTDYPFWRARITAADGTSWEAAGEMIMDALDAREAGPIEKLDMEYVSGIRSGLGGALYGVLGLSRELVDMSVWLEQTESGFQLGIVDARGTEHLLPDLGLDQAIEIVRQAVKSIQVPDGYEYMVTR